MDISAREVAVEGTSTVLRTAAYTLAVDEKTRLRILIESGGRDEITVAIAERRYEFAPLFQLVFRLVQPEMNVLDLGAHIGTFSLAAAALGANVLSVEASPINASLLKASVSENAFARVQVVTKAVGSHEGVLEFFQSGPYGTVANVHVPGPRISVPVTRVDKLLEEVGWGQVHIIKMDVEGSEIQAIEGMSALLSRQDPLVIYESNGHTLNFFGATPGQLMVEFERFGFGSYRLDGGHLVPVFSRDLQPECVVDYLAARNLPESLTRRLTAPMSPRERTDRILASCSVQHWPTRVYIARELATAPREILADAKIRAALDGLTHDPEPSVRAAAQWWDLEGGLP